jgi:hypothetical protein
MQLKLNENTVLNEYKVTVNGKNLGSQDMRGIEIRWSLDEIYTIGNIVFLDTIGMIEHGKVKVHDELEISYTDAMEEKYKQKFYITDVHETRADAAKIFAEIKFIDRNIINWMNTYESKGFSHGKLKDILEYYIPKYKKDLNPNNELDGKEIWGNKDSVSCGHVVPGDRSLAVLIQRWEQEGNFMFFQTRKDINITKWKKLTAKSPDEYPLKVFSPNQSYIGLIGDLRIRAADGVATNVVLSDLQEVTLKLEESGSKIFTDVKLKYTEIQDETGSTSSTDIPLIKSNGTENIAVRTNLSQKHKANYAKFLNNAIQMEVVVPGWAKRNIGDVVKVHIGTHDVIEDIDKVQSGKWLISKITDKVNQGFYTQKLTLIRSKHM